MDRDDRDDEAGRDPALGGGDFGYVLRPATGFTLIEAHAGGRFGNTYGCACGAAFWTTSERRAIESWASHVTDQVLELVRSRL